MRASITTVTSCGRKHGHICTVHFRVTESSTHITGTDIVAQAEAAAAKKEAAAAKKDAAVAKKEAATAMKEVAKLKKEARAAAAAAASEAAVAEAAHSAVLEAKAADFKTASAALASKDAQLAAASAAIAGKEAELAAAHATQVRPISNTETVQPVTRLQRLSTLRQPRRLLPARRGTWRWGMPPRCLTRIRVFLVKPGPGSGEGR